MEVELKMVDARAQQVVVAMQTVRASAVLRKVSQETGRFKFSMKMFLFCLELSFSRITNYILYVERTPESNRDV